MSTKSLPSDLPIHSFGSAQEFEAFLEIEHTKAPGIYLKFAKKSSGIASVTAAEAVEVALCYGWIDGRANGVDETWWLGRYTPRRPKSVWSQKNVNTIARLLDEGRMRPAGISAVDAAKADGRWERAYAGPATITVPDDLAAALAKVPAAAASFKDLNKSERYAVLWRVQTATPTSRAKRIEAAVQMLAVGNVPGRTERSTATPKNPDGVKKATVKRARSGQSAAPPKVIKVQPVDPSEQQQPRREGLRPRT